MVFVFLRRLRAIQDFWAYDSVGPWCNDAPQNTSISFRGIIEGSIRVIAFIFQAALLCPLLVKKCKILNFPYITGYTYLIIAGILYYIVIATWIMEIETFDTF